MNDKAREAAIIRDLETRGIHGVHASEWTPEMALAVLRENRRRYAHELWMQVTDRVGARLARELATETGVSAKDISTVLLAASAKLGSLVVMSDLPAKSAVEIMQCAADDLDQQAKAGEQL